MSMISFGHGRTVLAAARTDLDDDEWGGSALPHRDVEAVKLARPWPDGTFDSPA
jgi:hypothetical protein